MFLPSWHYHSVNMLLLWPTHFPHLFSLLPLVILRLYVVHLLNFSFYLRLLLEKLQFDKKPNTDVYLKDECYFNNKYEKGSVRIREFHKYVMFCEKENSFHAFLLFNPILVCSTPVYLKCAYFVYANKILIKYDLWPDTFGHSYQQCNTDLFFLHTIFNQDEVNMCNLFDSDCSQWSSSEYLMYVVYRILLM